MGPLARRPLPEAVSGRAHAGIAGSGASHWRHNSFDRKTQFVSGDRLTRFVGNPELTTFLVECEFWRVVFSFFARDIEAKPNYA